MPDDEDNMGAELFCLVRGHPRLDSVLSRLIGRGGDDRSLTGTGHGNGLALEIGVDLLLHGGEKGVHINAEDNLGHS